jgi:hypothetical protein
VADGAEDVLFPKSTEKTGYPFSEKKGRNNFEKEYPSIKNYQ